VLGPLNQLRTEDVRRWHTKLAGDLGPLLAGFGGLRLGELIGLQRGDIDVATNTVRIERQTVESPTENASRRHPRPTPAPGPSISQHPCRLRSPRTWTGSARRVTKPWCSRDRSRRPPTATLYKAWNKARRAAGLDQLHLHDVRHAAGTLAAQTGATTRELMSRLGHASPAAALRYQHAAERRDVRMAESLEVMLQTVRPPAAASQNQPADDVVWGNCGEEADSDAYPDGVSPLKPSPTRTFPRASDWNRTCVLSLGRRYPTLA